MFEPCGFALSPMESDVSAEKSFRVAAKKNVFTFRDIEFTICVDDGPRLSALL